MKVIFIVRLMRLMSEIKTMHGLTRELNTEEAIENIARICGLELEEILHCDTINDVFENIKVEEIEKIIKYMISNLIRSKMLEKGSKEIKELKLKIKEISQMIKKAIISTTPNLEVHNRVQLRFE